MSCARRDSIEIFNRESIESQSRFNRDSIECSFVPDYLPYRREEHISGTLDPSISPAYHLAYHMLLVTHSSVRERIIRVVYIYISYREMTGGRLVGLVGYLPIL